jgi:hypothetical protein
VPAADTSRALDGRITHQENPEKGKAAMALQEICATGTNGHMKVTRAYDAK